MCVYFAQREVEVIKQSVKDAKQRAREKLEEAKRATNTTGSEELSPTLKQVKYLSLFLSLYLSVCLSFSTPQDTTDAFPCHIHLPVCL